MLRTFPSIKQLDKMDCAPTCLMMVCKYFNKDIPLQKLRTLCDKSQQGVSLYGICKASEELGLNSLPLKLSTEDFISKASMPCILHWEENHFVVAYRTTKSHVFISDPAKGKIKLTIEQFKTFWENAEGSGVALLLKPTERFELINESPHHTKNGLSLLLNHLFRFKNLITQLGIGALIGSLLNLIFPFLTQALVDHGIGNRDLDFVYLIVIAQLVIFLSRTATEFIRGWIIVHMGTRINITILSEYLIKLTRLPLSYFNSRNLGDILQRIADHSKIEEFLTSHSISIVFSTFNLFMFSAILASYSGLIFSIFLIGSISSVIWVTIFLNKRKILDHQNFSQMSASQNNVVQLVSGMSEIKLNQCESNRRWEWEGIQAKLFNLRLKSLAVEQYQQAGNLFLNEGKNIVITFIAAQQVIAGNITLGMMMAITYILGQMNAPIDQLITFIRMAQDAKISIERLGEIHNLEEETDEQKFKLASPVIKGDIKLASLHFKYGLHEKRNALENVDLTIPHKKTTAIVGSSGSGKTTLMKLLLKFDTPTQGDILISNQDLKFVCPESWREKCGVVMQDGFIFSDTVANNIAMGHESIDFERLCHAAKTANIHREIEGLPQGYHTKIGVEGLGLSGGQTQRILIARSVYKNPEYLFFDEATSSLDTTNEKIIQSNLKYFFKGRTVLVIAHRLSTVKNSDNIIVLDKGRVVEQGKHATLAKKRGFYYELIKDQLDLGG